MIKKVLIRNNIIKPNHRSFPKRLRLVVGDTETVKGKPYTIQFYDGKSFEIFYVNEDNILDVFLKYLEKKAIKKCVNVMYFHNLEYDLSVILYKFHKNFLNRKKIVINYKKWKIVFVYSNTVFAIFKKKDVKFLILDSFRFVQTSLQNFGKMIGSKIEKMEKPVFLGKRKPKNLEERLLFEQYARQDVLLLWDIANWIIKKHKTYDVTLSFSNANFSERIFRHYFIDEYMNIRLPPKEWIEPCILSYHGGKNGYYLPKEEGVYLLKDGIEVDIVSAYPYAMVNLPSFSRGYYKEVDKIVEEYEGIYIVDGYCLNDKYPVLFTHDFKVIPYKEKIENLCITSYELKEAIKSNEIEIKKVKGIVYIPKSDINPLKDFVLEFFEKKKTANNEDEKMLYKIILNSLYGKFIQSIEKESKKNYDYVQEGDKIKRVEKEYIAGSCFNPFIASLITGFVRAYLHQLEHRYNAYHSSTDSIIIKNQKVENIGKNLGQLEIKVRDADCYLIRNKMYIWIRGDEIIKYATHGFLGTPEQLLEMIRLKKYEYEVEKMIKVREAERIKKQKLIKLAMNKIKRNINDVNFEKIIEI
ncbi:MAG: DNA polymerase [Elusimicrobiota bacterium]|nr:DNA polymerase [Endomicrobiia bacterium]MDW8166115.1 DNA polymerase [Elusimicrobiota bacterium]